MSSSEPPSKKRKLNDNTVECKDNCIDKDNYNICDEVRKTCNMILSNQDSNKLDVWIDQNAINKEIEKNGDQYKKQSIDELKWNKDPYHYFNENNIELTLRFILVLDSLNFCFWPLPKYEYQHLGLGLKHTLQTDEKAFNPLNLMKLNKTTLTKWLLCKFENKDKDGNDQDIDTINIPLIEERTRLLNETGRIIHYQFNDKVENLLKSANGSAVKLVEIMSKKFRGFADHCICPWNGKQIFFYKRAQIFVAEIYAAYKGKGIGDFKDIDKLTCFADYRVPQLLRGLGILCYNQRICNLIDNKQMILSGSKDEILIRASMIVAVEKLKDKLNEYNKKKNDGKNNEFISIEIDWCLWNRGEELNSQNKLKPHHRTKTIYY